MIWNRLDDLNQIESIQKESKKAPVVIFKHSTRCPVSAMAFNELERSWQQENHPDVEPYYLDVIQNRLISEGVAEEWNVMHQSPQIIIIHNQECIYDASHSEIDYSEIDRIIKSVHQM